MLHNLVWDSQVREYLGNVIIVLTSFLLIMNFIIIIIVSVRPICRKLYLKCL